MTDQEITGIKEMEDELNTPIAQLAEHCNDPKFLATVLSLAFNLGTQIGQRRTSRDYNEMLRGYNPLTIRN